MREITQTPVPVHGDITTPTENLFDQLTAENEAARQQRTYAANLAYTMECHQFVNELAEYDQSPGDMRGKLRTEGRRKGISFDLPPPQPDLGDWLSRLFSFLRSPA